MCTHADPANSRAAISVPPCLADGHNDHSVPHGWSAERRGAARISAAVCALFQTRADYEAQRGTVHPRRAERRLCGGSGESGFGARSRQIARIWLAQALPWRGLRPARTWMTATGSLCGMRPNRVGSEGARDLGLGVASRDVGG
jgi:hypothetical protein